MKHTKAFSKQLANSFDNDYNYECEKQKNKKRSVELRTLKRTKHVRWIAE